jgi:hypothetical protein
MFGSREVCSVAETTVILKPLPSEQTGLRAIIEKWKADEMKRQGDRPGSHSWWPWGLASFDYDNDGDMDLLAMQHGQPRTMIIRNMLKETGKLTFVNANPELGLPTNALAGCFKPMIWDFDGDGFLDLAYRDSAPETFFFNRQGKAFEAMRPGLGEVIGMKEVDGVDDNGLPFLVTTSARFFFDSGTRRFKREPWQPHWHAEPPAAIAALMREAKQKNRFFGTEFFEVNLGGRGRKDLAWGGFGPYGGPMLGRYLLAGDRGGFTDATEQFGLPKEGTPIYFADFNGDGIDDVLVVHTKVGGVYLSDGKGRYALRHGPLTDFLRLPDSYLHTVRTVDLDNEGVLDLVLYSGRNGAVGTFQNLGGGEFRQVLKASGWTEPVAICDINDDGLMDVCVGGPGDDITIYLNETPRAGTSCNLYPRVAKPNPFAVGARVQVFRVGQLGQPGAKPILDEKAHPDGTPIHVGLGSERTFDLRVVFPGKVPKHVERQGVEAKKKISIASSGHLEEIR